jgi:hypothetical protein
VNEISVNFFDILSCLKMTKTRVVNETGMNLVGQ